MTNTDPLKTLAAALNSLDSPAGWHYTNAEIIMAALQRHPPAREFLLAQERQAQLHRDYLLRHVQELRSVSASLLQPGVPTAQFMEVFAKRLGQAIENMIRCSPVVSEGFGSTQFTSQIPYGQCGESEEGSNDQE